VTIIHSSDWPEEKGGLCQFTAEYGNCGVFRVVPLEYGRHRSSLDHCNFDLTAMATLSEVNFAQSFLQQLSGRPVKYEANYTVPPSTLGSKPLIVSLLLGHFTDDSSSLKWNDRNGNDQLNNQKMQEVFHLKHVSDTSENYFYFS